MSKSAPERAFFAESGSKFEPLLIKTLCEPILPYIPASVHPNTITVITHLIAWMTAILAISSPHLPPLQQAMALIGAGIGMFLSMLGDCLDGLHARRTNQCSKLGELLDHWLDAMVVPLATIGMSAALQMAPWAMVTINVTVAMIYSAQLVLYHHTGRFIAPEPASGPEGQFGISLGYVAMAGFFYYVDRHQPWLDLAFAALAAAATFVQLKCTAFYFPKLGRKVIEHVWFVLPCAGFGAAYMLGFLDLHVFLLTVVFTSFRVCGTYVLRTIVKERYNGFDGIIFASVALIFAVHYLPAHPPAPIGNLRIENLIAAGACLYAVTRNFWDFSRHYRSLKPVAT